MKIIADGETFVGTARDIVRQMKESEWGHPEKKRDYMIEVTERVWDMTGVPAPLVETITAEKFLNYLLRAGVVTRGEE